MLNIVNGTQRVMILNDDGKVIVEDEKLKEQLQDEGHILTNDNLNVNKLSKLMD